MDLLVSNFWTTRKLFLINRFAIGYSHLCWYINSNFLRTIYSSRTYTQTSLIVGTIEGRNTEDIGSNPQPQNQLEGAVYVSEKYSNAKHLNQYFILWLNRCKKNQFYFLYFPGTWQILMDTLDIQLFCLAFWWPGCLIFLEIQKDDKHVKGFKGKPLVQQMNVGCHTVRHWK